MIELRDYQRAAIDALYAWFRAGRGSPLVVAPTGSGKSVILAEFARSAVVGYPETRILIVTHVRELIAQNHAALIRLWPDAPAGNGCLFSGISDLDTDSTIARSATAHVRRAADPKRARALRSCTHAAQARAVLRTRRSPACRSDR